MIWPTSLDGILADIMQTEGNFVNDPSDFGGPTKFGITKATLAAYRGHDVTDADVVNLGEDEAKAIYKQRFIDTPGYSGIKDVRLLYTVADTSILFGPKRATQFLQTALGVKVDGGCGPATVQAANAGVDTRTIVNAIAKQRIGYHCDRVIAVPDQLRFLRGWINRANEFIE